MGYRKFSETLFFWEHRYIHTYTTHRKKRRRWLAGWRWRLAAPSGSGEKRVPWAVARNKTILFDHCLLNLFVAKIFVLIKRTEFNFFAQRDECLICMLCNLWQLHPLNLGAFMRRHLWKLPMKFLVIWIFLFPRLFSYLPIEHKAPDLFFQFFFALMKNKLFEFNDLGSWIGGHDELSGEFGAGWILFEPQQRLTVKQVFAVK